MAEREAVGIFIVIRERDPEGHAAADAPDHAWPAPCAFHARPRAPMSVSSAMSSSSLAASRCWRSRSASCGVLRLKRESRILRMMNARNMRTDTGISRSSVAHAAGLALHERSLVKRALAARGVVGFPGLRGGPLRLFAAAGKGECDREHRGDRVHGA